MLFFLTAHAAQNVSTSAITNYNMQDLVEWGLAWVFVIAFFLTLVFILYGGISFILSGGQEDKVKAAISTIRYAIIGLFVTFGAMLVVQFIGQSVFGVDLLFVKMGDIISMAGQIVSGLGSGSSSTPASPSPSQYGLQ